MVAVEDFMVFLVLMASFGWFWRIRVVFLVFEIFMFDGSSFLFSRVYFVGHVFLSAKGFLAFCRFDLPPFFLIRCLPALGTMETTSAPAKITLYGTLGWLMGQNQPGTFLGSQPPLKALRG